MDKKTGRILAAILIAAAALSPWPPAAFAQEAPAAPYAVTATADWSTRVLGLTVSLDMAAAGLRLPSGRLEAERMIERDLPDILKSLVVKIQVDSYRNVGDCIADGSIDVSGLLGLSSAVQARESSFSKDMHAFVASYDLPLEAIAAIFVRHSKPTTPAEPLEYRPSRAYTGIVIYVSGTLPVRGERKPDILRPCLFPRLYDDTMSLLLDRNGVGPAAIAAWGEVGYATALDRASLTRVGDDPLRIDATALFGSDRTDILIPRDEAMKILSLPANRALLAAGRVILIIGDVKQRLSAVDAAGASQGDGGESVERAEGPLYEVGH